MAEEDADWFEQEQLHIAAADGDLERMRQLIAEGCNVDAFDETLGWTPLHYAANAESLLAVQLLIESGANINANDESKIGETPLGLVADRCSFHLATILVEAGADPTIPGFMNVTALDSAKDRRDDEGRRVYQLLADHAQLLPKRSPTPRSS